MAENETLKKHEQMMYCVARVRTQRAGGSGTVIYSGKNAEGEYSTFILTNNHVIDDAVQVKKVWDSMLGRETKKEIRQVVTVEFFRYNYVSRCTGQYGVEAEIVARNKEEDIALLRLKDINKVDHVARLVPKDQIKQIRVYDPVYACGAALGHSPIQTSGEVTCMSDLIDNYLYWMSNAQIIFGNSGGAIFRHNGANYELIGIPSRIPVVFVSAITHMGFFVPPERVYKFLDSNYYQFIYDSNYTIEGCKAKREKAKKAATRELLLREGRVEDDEPEIDASPMFPEGESDTPDLPEDIFDTALVKAMVREIDNEICGSSD